MGRVVLVTGVCRDLGGRFARLIAADPGVDRVIGVDVVPPRHDLGDVRFVRADIRNPVIAKVIAAEDVDTVVHLERDRHAERRRRAHVDEGDQRHRHHAAARRLPEGARRRAPGRQVVGARLRLVAARPGDVQRGDGAASGCRGRASARTPSRSRATSAASPAAAPTSTVTMLRCASLLGPQIETNLTRYFELPVDPDGGRLRRAAAVLPRGRRAGGACSTPRIVRRPRHLQRRRRRRADAVAGRPSAGQAERRRCPASRWARCARRSRRRGAPTSSASTRPSSRTAAALDTTAMREVLGFEPAVHDAGDVRRVRPAAAARARSTPSGSPRSRSRSRR